MKRYWKHIGLTALAVAMLMAIAAPALAEPASDEAAEHGLRVVSYCDVSGGGFGHFYFDTRYDPGVVQGNVIDMGDSEIYWSGNLDDVKMNQGWERVKAKVDVKVWGDIKDYGYVSISEPLDGVFSFDFTGTEPTELIDSDYILNETWIADGEWTIKVPSLPIEGHELGCFGYNFHTGDYGFYAKLSKWLSR